ncbi:heavy metal translocating P-type ATPase [Niameybacter massiliensis]|uniref:Cd(2+)-exporting ATPase n=1 Tax=Holtiella tumoricola TaxID=3018743 RepID=A0AA42DR51_9FIRM|nr:heavy metal translocating P-type ATPase [Holtiella tumoricola]MDA3733393.1 heavy metal translocating P-type ATPase [Holtiella tumoricola]
MKYLFRIEGIDCANCAAKIERALNKDGLFKEAYINFMLKKVEVHTEEKDSKMIEEKIRKIANKVEDGVVITPWDNQTQEATQAVAQKHLFKIDGIDCANCAAKIERALNKDDFFKEAYINFMLKKVEVLTEENNVTLIEEKLKKIANKVEDGVIIESWDNQASSTTSYRHEHGDGCGCGEAHHHSHKDECGCGVDHHHQHENGCGCGDHHHKQVTRKKVAKRTATRKAVAGKATVRSIGTVENNRIEKVKKPKNEVSQAPKSAIQKFKEYLKTEDAMMMRIIVGLGLLLFGAVSKLEVFTIISYVIVGYDIVLKAVKNIIKGKVFDENFLMTIATLAAFVIGEYSEAVAVMLFYQVGEYFQSKAVAKSRKAIEGLMDIKPEFARVKRNGNWVVVAPGEVRIGDTLAVRPGEKIPLDGIIVKGKSNLDHSALTGESVPVFMEEGSEVLSGSINVDQLIEIKVTQTLQNSTVSKILDLIENATSKKAQTEQFITKFAAVYTPAVVIAAALIAIIPSLVTGDWNHWIYTSIVFLVISCPCALVVSIPLGFFGGIGAASKCGVLIKGSNYLEKLTQIDTVVMDKTGTITKGSFEVIGIFPARKGLEEDLIRYAVQIERNSNHPIARAIANYRSELVTEELTDYTEKAGYGLSATLKGKKVIAGNERFMEMNHVEYKVPKMLGTSVHVAVDGEYIGCLIVADVVKEESMKAIEELKKQGIQKVIMLTGDKKEVAEYIGGEVGVDQVYAELLPQDKVHQVEKLIEEGNKVAFVGDGINDAPVLALADVGIAMGGIGSDAAVEASDIVLMQDNLMQINKGIEIAKYTKRIVKQNIIFALGTKFLVMILGILGFANMWLAVFADVGVSIIAILNAIRILPKHGKMDK